MGEPNTLTWTEVMAPDLDKAKAFYTELFGWSGEPFGEDGSYVVYKKDDQYVAGSMMPPGPMPAFWLTYFAVENADEAVAKATQLGGTIMREPTPIPTVGRFALINDPQGAGFGVLEPELSQQQ